MLTPSVRHGTTEAGPVHDVVGIGFGAANLGLAAAVAEHNADRAGPPVLARFVEQQPRFGWHRGMLIEDARMQVSFLKDLVTLRNPASRYSFLSYLRDNGRLIDFVNHQTFFPTRLEFHDYLEWVAGWFHHEVDYGVSVREIVPVDGDDTLLDVVGSSPAGDLRYRTRNVVIATGLRPHLPPGVRLGPRVWHNSELVPNVAALAAARRWGAGAPLRLSVVGAGQSAAETVDYLHRSFPDAQVHAVFGRYGYSPADDSPFANRVFDPDAAAEFFAAPEATKKAILEYHRGTNYSVVDPDLISSLYARHYAERVAGKERLRFHNLCSVLDVADSDDEVALTVESMVDGSRSVLNSDVVVYATGYRSGDPGRFLTHPVLTCEVDAAGRPRIARDYRLSVPGTRAGVYVQGATEYSHGISSTLLSNVAVRTGEIVAAIAARRGGAGRAFAEGAGAASRPS